MKGTYHLNIFVKDVYIFAGKDNGCDLEVGNYSLAGIKVGGVSA
jgi:hypothetical protein